MDGLTGIIAQLEKRKTAIERALAALREVEGIEGAASAPASSAPVKRKAGNTRSLAQKARWAAKKAGEAAPPATPQRLRARAEWRRKAGSGWPRR
jgi:hypothetical protein